MTARVVLRQGSLTGAACNSPRFNPQGLSAMRLVSGCPDGSGCDGWCEHSERYDAVEQSAFAATVCVVCPVRGQCLEAGLVSGDTVENGVWGGLTNHESSNDQLRFAQRNPGIAPAVRLLRWPLPVEMSMPDLRQMGVAPDGEAMTRLWRRLESVCEAGHGSGTLTRASVLAWATDVRDRAEADLEYRYTFGSWEKRAESQSGQLSLLAAV